MRDSITKQNPGQLIFPHSGTSANFLVRSRASSNGSDLQVKGFPNGSQSRLKRLELLNQKELFQNIKVQQSLRSMMKRIRTDEQVLQNPDNTRKYLEDRERERCHEAVSRIRRDVFCTGPLISDQESKFSKMDLSSLKGGKHLKAVEEMNPCRGNSQISDVFTTKEASSEKNVRNHFGFLSERTGARQSQVLNLASRESNAASKHWKSNPTKTDAALSVKTNHDYITLVKNTNSSVNRNDKTPTSRSDNLKVQIALPTILKECKPDNLAKDAKITTTFKHSLPLLDANSKFGIIKRTSELRSLRRSVTDEQTLPINSMCTNSNLPDKRIEIFANNYELLNSRNEKREQDTSNKLQFLDSSSFSEIDCNDFLYINNRVDNLSPMPAVIDHRKYWSNYLGKKHIGRNNGI